MVGMAALAGALWYGVLTAISPCPLATNLAAVSFIGQQVQHRRVALLSSLLYACGRSLAYVAVAAILAAGLSSIPTVSLALQKYLMLFMGPLLIVLGLFLLGWLGSSRGVTFGGAALHQRLAKAGPVGALVLGVLFALSFCPLSAALFFGRLIPVSLEHGSAFLLPVVFGVGSALPVIVFAVVLATAAHYVGKTYDAMRKVGAVARVGTGAVFIGVGVYLSLTVSFGLAI
jgi:cytochrome c biogenesis protein CcdA